MESKQQAAPVEVELGAVCVPGPDGHCATCADEATPARVVALREGNLAVVEMAGREQEVGIDLIDGVAAGDWLLIHAGFAIARLEQAE